MSHELALADHQTAQLVDDRAPVVTPEHWKLLADTIAKDASPEELRLFVYDCLRRRVHPLDKMIHFTKRRGKYTPVTSIDFFRTRAAETGEHAGTDEPVFTGEPGKPGFSARCVVYRLVQGQRYEFPATARWEEYKPDAGPTGEADAMWRRMPYGQLGKCAEALALRRGFPQMLGGLYIVEELDQALGNSPVSEGLRDAGRQRPARMEQAQEPQQEAKPAGPVDPNKPTRVKRVKAIAKGKTNGREWELFLVSFVDGREAATVEKGVVETARKFAGDKTWCLPTIVPGNKPNQYTLVEICLPREQPADEPAPADPKVADSQAPAQTEIDGEIREPAQPAS